VIANGQRGGAVLAAARGEAIGTTFAVQSERHSSFKLWLKYAKPVRGRVQVDAGAARALREGGTSLLPVGVVGVHGTFEAGDAIEVIYGSEAVGKGISNYSSEELLRVRGRRSAEVRELLPLAGDEAVHRDYFVLA
jgi:glutamate 5-kinase